VPDNVRSELQSHNAKCSLGKKVHGRFGMAACALELELQPKPIDPTSFSSDNAKNTPLLLPQIGNAHA